MHEAPVFLPPGQKVGPYAIERVLGHGANGIAYLAHDRTLDRKVVLKEHYPQGLCRRDSETHLLVPLNEEVAHTFTDSVDQFIREARLIASLEHPSIIRIHRVFSLSPTTCFYVMPLLEGGTLREVIHSDKRIPPRTIISWLHRGRLRRGRERDSTNEDENSFHRLRAVPLPRRGRSLGRGDGGGGTSKFLWEGARRVIGATAKPL